MKQGIIILILLLTTLAHAQNSNSPYIVVLGTVQDGGYPHMGCDKTCCNKAWGNPDSKKWVVSLALVNPQTNQWWLFEATPDIKEQLHYFQTLTKKKYKYLPDGIFITHAHIGHYTGLMQLGREVMGAKEMPVYVLPKMKSYIETNGPWSQLVSLHNISLRQLDTNSSTNLGNDIEVHTFTVPHRDEYSETAGFMIIARPKSYLFIPDINKWSYWHENDLATMLALVDYAFIDATFYSNDELPGKRMDEVPHPFVVETMALLKDYDKNFKKTVQFIHLNHTNPLLWDTSKQKALLDKGYNMAQQGKKY